MASPEQIRRNTTLLLALAGGGVSILAALSFGAGAKEGNSSTAFDNNGSSNRNCSTLIYHDAGQIKTITVPEAEAGKIQEELDKGKFDSIFNLQSCGETGSIILNDNVSLPQPTIENSADAIKTILASKQIGQRFEVTDRWNNVYLVEKESARLTVLEVRKQVSPVIPGMEPKQILPRNIIAVGQ